MNLSQLVGTWFQQVKPDNVIYLSDYVFERSRRWGLAPIHEKMDHESHVKWMNSYVKEQTRKTHNERVVTQYKQKRAERDSI